jgi:leader peptidase (prepilin peptidase)/N-methyltransferase
MPEWLGAAIAFGYGAVVGSFLNVCIYRLPAEQSIVSPPSHCPKCNTRLKGVDLVPLFSFLFLGRKCRYCGEPISWRYFFVELATGLLFAAAWLRFGLSIDFFVYAAFISALVVAFAVDLDLFIIPDQVSIVGVVLGLGRDLAHWLAGDIRLVEIPIPWTDFVVPMIPSVAGIVVCGGIFYVIAYVSFYAFRPKDEKELETYEGAMGGGDVKLAAATGAVLGVVPALASFLIAVVLGSVFGVALVIMRSARERKGMPWRTEIPFGPYMVAGAVTVILAQPQLRLLWLAWINLIAPR